jgi:ATP-binding cassette subfamily B (MDR/TAP) protein 1
MASSEKDNVVVHTPPNEKVVAASDDAQSSTAVVSRLNPAEKEIIDRQTLAPNEKVGYFSLFRYADGKDFVVMFVALIASIVAGACLPLMTVRWFPFYLPAWNEAR